MVKDFIINKIDRSLEKSRLEKFGIPSHRIDAYLKLKHIERSLLFSFRDLSVWGLNIKAPAKGILNNLSRLQNSTLTENKNILDCTNSLIIEGTLNKYIYDIDTLIFEHTINPQEFKQRKSINFLISYLRKRQRQITDMDVHIMNLLLSTGLDFKKDVPNKIMGNIGKLLKSYNMLIQSMIAEQEKKRK